jgi:hypothetical protein
MSVLTYLQQQSSAAVLSSAERDSISLSIYTLSSRLTAHFGSDITEHFKFGSFTRDTILPRAMDDHSDIDYMVVFADSGYKPQTYLDRLRRFVEAKYSRSEIYQSSPTIVLNLNHIKFELVPATKGFIGYQIPSGLDAWEYSDPKGFNQTLSDKNKAEGYHLKPVIRLAKYWNAKNGYVYSSFEFEKWMAEQYYFLSYNQRDYLFDVFTKLTTPTDTQWRREKVERAKRIVAEVKRLEGAGMPYTAEAEVKKLIPE